MDAADGWRLRPTAQPVSYLEPLSGQWISGSFDTAVKSEHPAARSSGVQPQATAGQVPEPPPLDCVGLMPSIRATAAVAGQPMPMPPLRAPNPWADAPPVQPCGRPSTAATATSAASSIGAGCLVWGPRLAQLRGPGLHNIQESGLSLPADADTDTDRAPSHTSGRLDETVCI